MRILSTLARTASGMKHAYAIVFTGLLLFELVRFRFRKGRNAEATPYNPGGRRY